VPLRVNFISIVLQWITILLLKNCLSAATAAYFEGCSLQILYPTPDCGGGLFDPSGMGRTPGAGLYRHLCQCPARFSGVVFLERALDPTQSR
jgi:hypothetical protein